MLVFALMVGRFCRDMGVFILTVFGWAAILDFGLFWSSNRLKNRLWLSFRRFRQNFSSLRYWFLCDTAEATLSVAGDGGVGGGGGGGGGLPRVASCSGSDQPSLYPTVQTDWYPA